MVKFKSFFVVVLTLLSLSFCSCHEDPTPIEGTINYTWHWMLTTPGATNLSPGDALAIEKISFKPKEINLKVKIKHVDFFLGNKLIGASNAEPHSLYYQIPEDLTPGNYVFHMDFYLTADKHNDTRIQVTQAVLIVEKPKQ